MTDEVRDGAHCSIRASECSRCGRYQLTASGAAQFPLLDWGRRKSAVKSREEDREQAYLRYRSTVLQALRDVEDPLAQIAAERRRNAALQRAVVDAQSSAKAAVSAVAMAASVSGR